MKLLFELSLDLNFVLLPWRQLFFSAGASPLYTLGVTYIDDNVSKKMSSVYLGEIFLPHYVLFTFHLVYSFGR